MDKTITTALLIIISMATALVLFNAAFPAVVEGSDALQSMAAHSEDQIRSQIQVIHLVGELDGSGWWQDTNANGLFDVFAWVKNTGLTRFNALDEIDVFYGAEGNFVRIPHQSDAGGSYPYWSWQIENATEWVPSATLRVTIHYNAPQPSGRYFFRITTPNGTSDDEIVSM
ncbi:MAG: hypothetical protein KC496_05435 [Anaerolineae bacterium]|nr:hypothetical protein [Anaerolineae bacterium]